MANTQTIFIADPIFVYQNEQITNFQNREISELTTGSIVSSLTFSENNTLQTFITFTLNNQETFSTNAVVSASIFPQSIDSTIVFGDEEQLKFQLFILDQGVDSTLAIGTANVFVSTGPQPIESNVTFGDFDRPRPVHRSLIFKDDNITKLGNNDDVEISSGIVIQSSQQVSNTATSGENNLPDNPVGFVKITIDGVEYKMPYYNL